MQLGYADTADLYWQQGWKSVLPLPPGQKERPPVGYTGRDATTPSYADITTWAETRTDANLAIRLPDGVIGIDVDQYSTKRGGETLTKAEKLWGALPDAPRSTSRRNDTISGIRLFKVPPGTRLADRVALDGTSDIEIIQSHHRYLVCWPSTHPDSGATYTWVDTEGYPTEVPALDDIPALPDAWLAALIDNQPPTVDNGERYKLADAIQPGDMSPQVAQRLATALNGLTGRTAGSRHDVTRGHVLAIMRLGKEGHTGTSTALRQLGTAFVNATTSDGSRTVDMAEDEYRRMITGDGAARELAQPSQRQLDTEWVDLIPLTANAGELVKNPLENAPDQQKQRSSSRRSANTSAVFDPQPYEQGFWDTRESLKNIYTTALAKMCSPWAVLAQCAARALTTVPPNVVLPGIIGGKQGSLNWFAAIAGPSGIGKGAAEGCARLLVPAAITERNPGSGEGLIAAYKPTRGGDPDPDDTAVNAILFNVAEVDTLTALGGRTGATIMPILRSGFSGETLGFAYADRTKRTHIEGHTYRMTLVLSVQPERAGGLLADAGGGTPQRFMWFPAADPRITGEEIWPSGPLQLPSREVWRYGREIVIPEDARTVIRQERVKAMRGEQGALNGHALFCREKFAFALAVLDGRYEVTQEDWELSGIAATLSDAVRDWVAGRVDAAKDRDAEDRGRAAGITREVSEAEHAARRQQRLERIAEWAAGKLRDGGPMTAGQLRKMAASRDRTHIEVALAAFPTVFQFDPGTRLWTANSSPTATLSTRYI